MLNPLESVLVMVDIQGSLADVVDRSELVLPRALQILKGCQTLDIPVLATVQVPEKLGPVLHELEEALGNTIPIPKAAFSAVREPEFLLALRQTGRTQVLLTGIESHVCVLQTGLDLLDSGFEVYLLCDAVFSRTAENCQLGIQRLLDAGAVRSGIEIALFELIRTSVHPQFRTISKLIK